jgi:hypothetical protein
MEEEIIRFLQLLALGVYKWLSERYKLSWLNTSLTVISILVGLLVTGVICVEIWRKARAFDSRLRIWWETPQTGEPEFRVRRKTLVVLIAMAAWVTIVCIVAQRTTTHLFYFLELTLTYSLPALLFGGVILWWLWESRNH